MLGGHCKETADARQQPVNFVKPKLEAEEDVDLAMRSRALVTTILAIVAKLEN